MHRRTAFSLVELSIVLVIVGLLVGGIFVGRSLIRASELRAVTAEFDRYVTATQTFRDKYFGLPGDITNATGFWGDQATGTGACADAAVTDGTPGTCNGNGDRIIDDASGTTEGFRYWQQLAMAGLVEGAYSGIEDAGTIKYIGGTNAPLSKLNQGVWSVLYRPNHAGSGAGIFAADYQQLFIFGGAGSGTTAYPTGLILRPEDAWNIDNKLDDSKPGLGRILSNWNSSCTTAASATDTAAAIYLLTDTGLNCYLRFAKAF
ncbi:MAG: prepilin-type N-terminal cleavage/methylation domain-containing protein [Pseudomonadota bacterium]